VASVRQRFRRPATSAAWQQRVCNIVTHHRPRRLHRADRASDRELAPPVWSTEDGNSNFRCSLPSAETSTVHAHSLSQLQPQFSPAPRELRRPLTTAAQSIGCRHKEPLGKLRASKYDINYLILKNGCSRLGREVWCASPTNASSTPPRNLLYDLGCSRYGRGTSRARLESKQLLVRQISLDAAP
jgi:hypothetical protein